MDPLQQQLARIGWSSKEGLYRDVYKAVQYVHTVPQPAISIIVISWRYVPELLENFTAFGRLRHVNFELIFVNNGKEDSEFAGILPLVDVCITLNRNTGAYLARNIGAAFAKAPLLLFLEDDGIALPGFIEAHLRLHQAFDIISARGVYRPRTQNSMNAQALHYHMGRIPCPMYVNLEGNASYRADAFYRAGGWDDHLYFGHGGPELSYRLTQLYPDKTLQMYSPLPVLLHDYGKSNVHFTDKIAKQKAATDRLRQQHDGWDEFIKSWRHYYKKSYLLKRKQPSAAAFLFTDIPSYLVTGFLSTAKPLYRYLFKRNKTLPARNDAR